MSYLVYLNHYNIRQCEAQYLSVFYEVLGKNLDATFILNKGYLTPYKEDERWEVRWARDNGWCSLKNMWQRALESDYFLLPYPETMTCKKGYFYTGYKVPSQILKDIVNMDFVEQEALLEKVLLKRDIKAGITWVNNSCFKKTLQKYDKKVIHHEMGPLRPSTYIPTVYFDFSGVNGSTEFDKRFQQFLKISNEVPILNRRELLRIVSPDNWEILYKVLDNKKRNFDIGVGLQVEVDTNLLLFNNGINWVDPILQAEIDSAGQVLVRQHPSAGFSLTPIDRRIVVDDIKKRRPYDFINDCNKIYCLNSSIGFEAMLLGREAKIFGDSPFRNICDYDEETKLKALNFVIFGYLTHRDLLFNSNYYEYRLVNIGNEKGIYLDNMKRLIKKAGR